MDGTSRVPRVLEQFESDILAEWLRQQVNAAAGRGSTAMKEADLRQQARDFLSLLRSCSQNGSLTDINGPAWAAMHDFLMDLSRTWARLGFSPAETANFIFSLKLPLFSRMRQEYGTDGAGLAAETWTVSVLLDNLALFTTEAHQKSREEVIARQQQELLELSTPVVKLWEGILALPLIGTLDSQRTAVVMESLLQKIVDTGSGVAIIDITGVPTVDTLVAQHLLKTVSAAKLMGAECIISGIRPQIAQTIVHLGIDLGEVSTRATLADALMEGLRRLGTELHPLTSAARG